MQDNVTTVLIAVISAITAIVSAFYSYKTAKAQRAQAEQIVEIKETLGTPDLNLEAAQDDDQDSDSPEVVFADIQAPAAPTASAASRSRSLEDLIDSAYRMARHKGFWDSKRNVGELLMLLVSEAGEAVEAHRKGLHSNPAAISLYKSYGSSADGIQAFKAEYETHIKGTFEEELADIAIRLFDMSRGLGVDLEYHISQKMRYNSTRERLHGKKY